MPFLSAPNHLLNSPEWPYFRKSPSTNWITRFFSFPPKPYSKNTHFWLKIFVMVVYEKLFNQNFVSKGWMEKKSPNNHYKLFTNEWGVSALLVRGSSCDFQQCKHFVEDKINFRVLFAHFIVHQSLSAVHIRLLTALFAMMQLVNHWSRGIPLQPHATLPRHTGTMRSPHLGLHPHRGLAPLPSKPDIFKLEAWTPLGKRPVGIRLKCLLVLYEINSLEIICGNHSVFFSKIHECVLYSTYVKVAINSVCLMNRCNYWASHSN